MKILIADYNPHARQMIRQCLRHISCEIIECSDGEDVLSFYREYWPDWVLMDCEMKTVDGIETTRRVLEEFPAARVIIVTNYDENSLRQAAKEAGALGFVLKDDLTALDKYLDHSLTNYNGPLRKDK